MLEAVKVALDPTPRQERLLESHAGAARFAYNAGLAHVKAMLERQEKPEWSYYALRRWWNANKDALAVSMETGKPWWPENSKESYNSGLESLADALKNFSKSRKGQRKGRRMGFPRFKSKDKAVPGFAYTTGSFDLIDCDPHALRLPKIGRVHCMENASRRVNGARVLRMSVSKRGGRWQASLTVERADLPIPSPPKGGSVGIDLGVKELATLSDGTVIHNPHALKSNLGRLRKAQRNLSRKRKGSNRRRKARTRVARLHARVADLRRDLLDKTTTMLARAYADISIEDLNVAGMVRNHRLARSVEDAAFAEFRRQLEYKTARTGARAPRHRPLVSKQQDMFELRDGESQTVPVRTCLPLRGVRACHRPRSERGHQHPSRRECPGDVKRARRKRKIAPTHRVRNAGILPA